MTLDASTPIAPNFALAEFMRPNVPEDYPGAWVSTKLVALGDVLQWLRELAGVPGRVTSAYRSPEHNAAVHGADDSQHMDGDAADVVFALMPQQLLARRVLESVTEGSAPAFGQVILYGDTGHVHASNPAARLGDRNGGVLFSPGTDANGARIYEQLGAAIAAGDVPLLSQPQALGAAGAVALIAIAIFVAAHFAPHRRR